MAKPTQKHYLLQVIRVNRDMGGREAKLYVEIELRINGTTCRKTRPVKDDGTLDLKDTFSFALSDPYTILRINLKTSKGYYVAHARKDIRTLLRESGKNHVQLNLDQNQILSLEPWKKVQQHFSSVDLHLTTKEVLDIVEDEVNIAMQSIEHLENRVDRRLYRCDVIGFFIEAAGSAIDAVNKVSGSPPLLGLVQTLTLGLFKLVARQFEADKELIGMVEEMNDALKFSLDLHKSTLCENFETFKPLLDDLLEDIVQCARFVQEYANRNLFSRLLRFPYIRKIREYKGCFVKHGKRLDWKIKQVTGEGVVNANERLGHMDNKLTELSVSSRNADQKSRLSSLLGPDFSVNLANKGDNLSGRRRCLEGTRTTYLQKIEQFVSSATNPRVLWLSGVAGSGKSTIALTALDKLSENLIYLFFERGKSTPDNVVRALACDLAAVHPSVAPFIVSAAKSSVKDKSLKVQFDELLLKPLLAAKEANVLPETILIMLDALDECGTAEQRRDLLQLLNTGFPQLPNTRCIVTSRPEDDIMKEFSSSDDIHHMPLKHDSPEGREDVVRYIKSEIELRFGGSVRHGKDMAPKIQELADAADGLFIWATTAIEMAFGDDVLDPWEKLGTLLDDIRLNGAPDLDGLYEKVLKQVKIDWRVPKWIATFASVMGFILVTKEALSGADIANFLGIEKSVVDRLLGQLRSVLDYEIGRPVRRPHASFADYLFSPIRSEDKPWNISELDQRMAVTERCFDVMDMDDNLRFNICRLETSFVRNEDIPDLQKRINRNIPSHLLYACRYWDVHMCELSSDTWNGLLGKLDHFLKCHLLHWFEVLSLMNDYNRIAGRALYDVSLHCPATDRELSSFLWASYKLASAFAYPISQSAPQIYLSAVSLWRFESIVAKHYSTRCPTICVNRIGTKPPARYTQILRGLGALRSEAFSSDGRRIAACSWLSKGFELSVWNSASGMRISTNSIETLSNWHSRWPTISFSHNIKHLAINQPERAFSIWDVESSKLVSGPFEGHDDYIVSLAFSPDCKHIASGSRDRTIRIWNVSTGSCVSKLVGHEKAVSSIAFSPDGRYLASGSLDGAICIWDVHSGKLIGQPPNGHTDNVTSVAFSPNGEYVASSSWDRTVRIWNVVNGVLVSSPLILEGHIDGVNSVAFSTDSSYVASGFCDLDGTIIIGDVNIGARVCGPLDANLGRVHSVSFSPDGRRLMTCHLDAICIWDFDSCKIDTVTSEGHTVAVTSVAFSPDSKYAASGSEDKTIRVWNTVTGELVLHLKGHTDAVYSVAFSSDGTQIVSGSSDKSVRVWDAINGKPVLHLKGHTDIVTSVAFLSDGTSIVSASQDDTIRIWSADSGAPIIDHSNATRCLKQIGKAYSSVFGYRSLVSLSPDGRHAVSVDQGRTCIWDLTSGVIVSETLSIRESGAYLVALSSDRSRVVLCRLSQDRSYVSVFDVNSGRLLDDLEGHTQSTACACAFSPDGRSIVTGSKGGAIRIWRLKRELDYTGEFTATVSSSSIGETGPGYWNDDGGDSSIVDVKSRTRKSSLSNWTISEDGWVLSERGELLTWIPEDMRATLWRPRNTAVLSQFSTKLDFVNSPIGPGWPEGFSLPDS